ncbi:MAG: polymer-forming cytoskeletal protein [Gemmatimonadaceae bacterium]
MAIFKEEKQDGKNGSTGEGALSIIAAGMTVSGDIESSGVVKVEGRVDGSIRSARQVLVGRQGTVHGDIDTREAVIGGTVEGMITASERVEIQATASVQGDIVTRTIVVAEGGKINGTVRMEEGKPGTRQTPAAPVAEPLGS